MSIFDDPRRIENKKRLEAFEKPDQTLKNLYENFDYFRTHVQEFFAYNRKRHKISVEKKCFVVVVVTRSGSHEGSTWTPSYTDTYTVDHLENLVITEEMTYDTLSAGYGFPGTVFYRDVDDHLGGLRWPVNVPEESWKKMLVMLERLSDPIVALDFLFSLLEYESEAELALSEAKKTISDFSYRLQDIERELNRQSGVIRAAIHFREVVNHPVLKFPSVKRAIVDFDKKLTSH